MRFTVKLGGSILEDTGIRRSILHQIKDLRDAGHQIILVHGGGKSLNRRLSQLGIESRFVDGLRVTDSETLKVALMVLAGEVNKTLVAELGGLGAIAIGICGADAAAIRCTPVSALPGGVSDLGYVGKPASIRSEFFELLIGAAIIPVVASIAIGEDFQPYNVNADQMAAICAWGTNCSALVYLTDVGGVLDSGGSVIPTLTPKQIEGLRSSGGIAGGMLPKTGSCLEALERGVSRIQILPGSSKDVLSRFFDGKLMEGTCINGNN